MKHLPIGKLVEKVKDNKVLWRLSLFNGQIEQDFENPSDALEIIANHSEALLKKHKLLSEICVLVKHKDHRKHYILIDANFNDGSNEINVYEETEYEYISSHPLFHKLYERRRLVNERKFNFDDICRSSINWSPWFTWIFGILLGLMFFFGSSTLISYLDFISNNTTGGVAAMNVADKSAFYIGIWFTIATAWFVPVMYYLAFYLGKRKFHESNFEYARLNWRKWYVWRMNILKICFVIYATTIYFTVSLLLDVENMVGSSAKLVWINSIVVLSLLIVSMLTISYILFYEGSTKLFRTLRMYLTKDERLFFWRWYWKKTNQMLVKVDQDFFFLDPEDTAFVAKQEMEETTQIVAKMTKQDIKLFAKKTRHAHHVAMIKYRHILKQQKQA